MKFSKYIQFFSEKSDLDEKQLSEAFKYMFLVSDNISKQDLRQINKLSICNDIKKSSYQFIETFFKKNIKLTTICWNVRHLFFLIYKHSESDEELSKFVKLCLHIIFDSKKSCDNLKILSKKKENKDIFGDVWWKTVNTLTDEPQSWYIGKSKNGKKLYQKNKFYDEDAANISKKILTTDTNLKSYDNIKLIHNHFSNSKIRERCKIIIWMRYRIDLKTYQYENDIRD